MSKLRRPIVLLLSLVDRLSKFGNCTVLIFLNIYFDIFRTFVYLVFDARRLWKELYSAQKYLFSYRMSILSLDWHCIDSVSRTSINKGNAAYMMRHRSTNGRTHTSWRWSFSDIKLFMTIKIQLDRGESMHSTGFRNIDAQTPSYHQAQKQDRLRRISWRSSTEKLRSWCICCRLIQRDGVLCYPACTSVWVPGSLHRWLWF